MASRIHLEHLKPFTFPLSYPSAIVRSLFINKTSNFIFQNGCHLIMTDLNYYVFFNHRREFHFMMASEKKSSASTLIEWERKTNHIQLYTNKKVSGLCVWNVLDWTGHNQLERLIILIGDSLFFLLPLGIGFINAQGIRSRSVSMS